MGINRSGFSGKLGNLFCCVFCGVGLPLPVATGAPLAAGALLVAGAPIAGAPIAGALLAGALLATGVTISRCPPGCFFRHWIRLFVLASGLRLSSLRTLARWWKLICWWEP